jgi:putative transposase
MMLPLIYDCLLPEEKAVINQQGKGFGSFWRCLLGVRLVDCPHCQKQHDRDINAAINIKNEGLRVLALGTSASTLGGDVRPRSSGRKKSMKAEAIPVELGSPHPICTQMGVG